MTLKDTQHTNGRTLLVRPFTSDAEHNEGQAVVNLAVIDSQGVVSVFNADRAELLKALGVSQ